MTQPDETQQQEGKVRFHVGTAFYRPQTQVARDLGVLAAALQRTDRGHLRVLDVMTGCGVRSLRYAIEAGADFVWANDANPDIHDLLQQNLAGQLPTSQYQITHLSAQRVFYDCACREDYYDVVDVDAFGSPATYLGACLQATKWGGLIYLTSTDGRSISGHFPDQSLQQLGGYARSHPAIHEQALRLLLGSLHQQATFQGWGIQPIVSLYQGQTYRVMVRLQPQQRWHEADFGWLGYCHHCGHYQTVGWRELGRSRCPEHVDPVPLVISGPLWLGALHDRPFVQRMGDLATQWGWTARAALLQILAAEADLPPYYFTLGEIGRRGKLDIPGRDRLLQALQAQGYAASPTHMTPEAIKTTAPFRVCVAVAQEESQPHKRTCTGII
jgi:tRNA (guanine26-N2/guanine27-N2)-dimethyltransferase